MLEIVSPPETEKMANIISTPKSYDKTINLNPDRICEYTIYQPKEEFFNYHTENQIFKDEEETIKESNINSYIHNICNKKIEEESSIIIFDFFPKYKESEKDKLYIFKDKNNNIDNINEGLNLKEIDSKYYEIKNKKEENTFNEKSKFIFSKEISNIADNSSKDKINFNSIKIKNGLFNTFYIFSPLISLENIKLENKNSQRKLIRNKIKEIKEAIKENKKENILYSLNQGILFISKEKNIKKDIKNVKIKKRKFCSDNIISKIKARFLKAIINCLNKNLKYENSEKYFTLLPQCFVKDITKKGNGISLLNMTFEELIKKDFYEEYNKKDKDNKMINKKRNRNIKEKKILDKKIRHNPDKEKYQVNIKTINYLETNKEISNRINFDNIKKRTYGDLFKEYLESHEFEESVLELLKEVDVTQKYIINYIIKAFEYIDYFSNSNK